MQCAASIQHRKTLEQEVKVFVEEVHGRAMVRQSAGPLSPYLDLIMSNNVVDVGDHALFDLITCPCNKMSSLGPRNKCDMRPPCVCVAGA